MFQWLLGYWRIIRMRGDCLKLSVWLLLLVVMTCFAANSVITRYLVLVSRVSPFILTVVMFVSGLATLIVLTSASPTIFRKGRLNFSYLPGALFLGAHAFSISYGYLFIPVAAGKLSLHVRRSNDGRLLRHPLPCRTQAFQQSSKSRVLNG